MAPNKLDNTIKTLLESRDIQPSKTSWDALHERLDKETKSSKIKWVWLSGIAASFIGLLLLLNLNTNTTELPIVNTTIKTPVKTESKSQINNSFNKVEPNNTTIVKNDIVVKATSSSLKKTNVNSVKNERLVKLDVPTTINKSIAQVVPKTKREDSLTTNATLTQKTDINKTQNEVDALLNNALLAVNEVETKTIDAESLLYDVETEVEASFRTKMFAKIKENASILKTAIVERNK